MPKLLPRIAAQAGCAPEDLCLIEGECVAGVVFGQCTRCSPDNADSVSVADVMRHHLGPLQVPVCIGANIGHVANQLSLPSGARVRLDTAAGTLAVMEAITA